MKYRGRTRFNKVFVLPGWRDRNVNRSAVIFVINMRALAEHVGHHPEDCFFVPGIDARGEDHCIAFIEREHR